MNAINFEYDGKCLSDYGFIICTFDVSTGATIVDSGSKIVFDKVSRNQSKSYSLVNTKYEGCIQTTFDICKNPEIFDYEDREISEDEFRELMRWLNRREFLKFQIFDDEFERENNCFFNVSFNIDKIKIAEKLYGLRLHLESDKPFGYGKQQCLTHIFYDTSEKWIINDISDEIGYIYPSIEITVNLNGDLSIFNDRFEDNVMTIDNCSVGEFITIDGEIQSIDTDDDSHDICNDFNYEFLKLENTINNRVNRISVSKPCEITIKYTPIVKAIL